MKRELSVLLLEDNPVDVELIQAILESEGFNLTVTQVDSENGFRSALQNLKPDLIISDFSLPSYNGQSALIAAREISPAVPFIFFSGTIGEEAAIDALKMGATDYVLKQNPKRLVAAIDRAVHQVEQRH